MLRRKNRPDECPSRPTDATSASAADSPRLSAGGSGGLAIVGAPPHPQDDASDGGGDGGLMQSPVAVVAAGEASPSTAVVLQFGALRATSRFRPSPATSPRGMTSGRGGAWRTGRSLLLVRSKRCSEKEEEENDDDEEGSDEDNLGGMHVKNFELTSVVAGNLDGERRRRSGGGTPTGERRRCDDDTSIDCCLLEPATPTVESADADPCSITSVYGGGHPASTGSRETIRPRTLAGIGSGVGVGGVGGGLPNGAIPTLLAAVSSNGDGGVGDSSTRWNPSRDDGVHPCRHRSASSFNDYAAKRAVERMTSVPSSSGGQRLSIGQRRRTVDIPRGSGGGGFDKDVLRLGVDDDDVTAISNLSGGPTLERSHLSQLSKEELFRMWKASEKALNSQLKEALRQKSELQQKLASTERLTVT